MRLIGVLEPGTADDPDVQARGAAFLRGLQQLGWIDGGNVRIDTRWTTINADNIRKHVAELVALKPDLIVASGTSTAVPLVQATRIVPIVFVGVTDPVSAGLVGSLARPGGNATGFMQFEYGLTAKWPELLKEIAPGVKRVAVLRNPALTGGIGQFAIIQYVASLVGVEVSPVDVRNIDVIERAMTSLGRTGDGGVIVTADGWSLRHRKLIIRLAALHKLPAVYSRKLFATDGGLISYGTDRIDLFRQAAAYVDRILKGEKPADLPVQAPTKYELAVNLKTAKALGLTVPPTLLARADEVID
jgi:putative ABC transport system substrate-binding protein